MQVAKTGCSAQPKRKTTHKFVLDLLWAIIKSVMSLGGITNKKNRHETINIHEMPFRFGVQGIRRRLRLHAAKANALSFLLLNAYLEIVEWSHFYGAVDHHQMTDRDHRAHSPISPNVYVYNERIVYWRNIDGHSRGYARWCFARDLGRVFCRTNIFQSRADRRFGSRVPFLEHFCFAAMCGNAVCARTIIVNIITQYASKSGLVQRRWCRLVSELRAKTITLRFEIKWIMLILQEHRNSFSMNDFRRIS